MIKLKDLLFESNNILIPRRSKEERDKNYNNALQRKIQKDYVKNNVLLVPDVSDNEDFVDGGEEDEELYLNLMDTPITHLPDNITKIIGTIELSYSKIQKLPTNLSRVERGSLFLNQTKLTELPKSLSYVQKSLYLTGTPVTSLPDNLTIGESLRLSGTLIRFLPDNLTVGDLLDLNKTPIESIPNNLIVKGDIWLSKTPLIKKYKKQQLKQLLSGVKGRILV